MKNEGFSVKNGFLKRKATSNSKVSKIKVVIKNKDDTFSSLKTKIGKKSDFLNDDINYGAKIIGKTVVEAAKYCNKLTETNDISKKELVNLILGKTEIIKKEILEIVISDGNSVEKTKRIDEKFDLAIDYFKSVVAQSI